MSANPPDANAFHGSACGVPPSGVPRSPFLRRLNDGLVLVRHSETVSDFHRGEVPPPVPASSGGWHRDILVKFHRLYVHLVCLLNLSTNVRSSQPRLSTLNVHSNRDIFYVPLAGHRDIFGSWALLESGTKKSPSLEGILSRLDSPGHFRDVPMPRWHSAGVPHTRVFKGKFRMKAGHQ